METATAPPLPTAPELPTASSATSNDVAGNNMSINSSSSTTSGGGGGVSSDRVDTDNIGWSRAKQPESNTSELRQRATSYSFTGSALASGNIADLNETGAAAVAGNENGNSSNTSNDKDKEQQQQREREQQQNDESLYECNICLDTAKDAVVSMCGHLFCWPCLHQWLLTRPNRKLCPVCKAAVDKDKVIPLYGRNSTRQEDPR